MKILLVCTRDPGGRQAGRKAVLKSMVSCLTRLGHMVELAVLAPGPLGVLDRDFPRVPIHRIDPPSWPHAALNAVLYFSRGRLTLNECLFYSGRTRREVHGVLDAGAYDLVIGDMIRSVPVLADVDLPVVIDLDDRLSERYVQISRGAEDSWELLGYSAPRFPSALRVPVTWTAMRLLRREARMLARREVAVARSAAAVALVGAEEAARLHTDAGVRVFTLPMAVDVEAAGAPVQANAAGSMVFTGGLDYHANAEAIRWFASQVLPLLRERLPEFSLTAIGYCPERLRRELEQPGLVLAGYVKDLRAQLSRHRAFLAPIRSGQGIKTKVLEAMAVGLPVVSTQQGLTGLNVKHGETCLLADSPVAFADCAVCLAAAPKRAAEVGEAGRLYVQGSFSLDVLTARWREVLESTCGDPAERVKKR